MVHSYCFERFFFMSKFLRWVVAFLYFFVMRMRNWHLDTGLKLFLKISPIPVFDPPLVQSLLGHQLLLGLSCFTSSNYEDETLGALERR